MFQVYKKFTPTAEKRKNIFMQYAQIKQEKKEFSTFCQIIYIEDKKIFKNHITAD